MKWLAALVALLTTTCFLFADGSSGEFLLSPDFTETGTKKFGGSSDTYNRGDWYATGTVYARKNGAGLGKESSGTLSYEFPEGKAEYIHTLTMECATATKASASKEQTLCVTFITETGETLTYDEAFTTGSQTRPVTLVLNFEEAKPIKKMSFTNLGAQIFELCLVEWASSLAELELNYYVTSRCTLQGNIIVAINGVEGGTGTYSYASIKMGDDLLEWNNPTFPISHDMIAPTESGVLPVEICVRDDAGNEKRITRDVIITPYAQPRNLVASNITRNGFDLTWDMSSGTTPLNYEIHIQEELEKTSATIAIEPTWTETETGEWVSSVISLIPWTNGNRVTSAHLTNSDYSGDLWLSKNNGDTWEKKMKIGMFLLGSIPANTTQNILFKVNKTPPKFLNIKLSKIENVTMDVKFDLASQQRIYSVTGLTSGKKYRVRLDAFFNNVTDESSGEVVNYTSDPIIVQTLSLSGFTNIEVLDKYKRLQLTWPKGYTNLTGEINFFAQRALSSNIPTGLYLSGVLWTKSGGNLSTAKAIVLTNTSTQPITLKGKYVLKSVKRDTGYTTKWDFSTELDDGSKLYPCTIPAGGELVIAHSKYPPSDLREGVVQASKTALNFTGDYDLSLWCGETLQNSLTPQTNAVVRLVENSLTETKVTSLTEDLPIIDSLYSPWMNTVETVLLDSRIVQLSFSTLIISYSSYLTDLERSTKIWATCRTMSGSDSSLPTEVILWSSRVNPGYRFSLR